MVIITVEIKDEGITVEQVEELELLIEEICAKEDLIDVCVSAQYEPK